MPRRFRQSQISLLSVRLSERLPPKLACFTSFTDESQQGTALGFFCFRAWLHDACPSRDSRSLSPSSQRAAPAGNITFSGAALSAARSFLIKRFLTRPASRGATRYRTIASSHVFSLGRKNTRGRSRTSSSSTGVRASKSRKVSTRGFGQEHKPLTLYRLRIQR